MPDPIFNPGPVSPTPAPEAPVPEPSPLTMRAALDRRRDFLVLMPADEVKRNLRLDLKVTGAIVSGAIPLIMQHRDSVLAQFGDAGAKQVDELQELVYAALQAEAELVNAESGAELAELADRLGAYHRYVVNELESLAFRKLLDRSRIDPGRPVQGYRQLVSSTFTLIDLVRAILSQVAGKTALTMDELVEIERVATLMFDTLNARELGAQRVPAAELRTRALSHLVSVYDQVRRMITYVRWAEGDADAIAPSLYAARRGFLRASPSSSEAESPSAPAVTPASPAPATPTPATPETPIDPVPGSGPAPFTS